ncbi:methyltransferase domain-containing protein [Streptomyces sp. NPDC050528]|uniref:methyltransferase domain-containing protein n=1 Tax=unclassified Streptomyces TaxID=2593676 RepID=UPI00378BDF6B
MPVGDEPDIINSAIPPAVTILELGAGAGRLTHPLVELGHRLVAVDECAEMLTRIHRAETKCARIEELNLTERFDVVLLASYFVNAPSLDVLHRLLSSCRRHVAESGRVIIQQEPPGWDCTPMERTLPNGMLIRMRDVSVHKEDADLHSATMDYAIGDQLWTQSFTSRKLSESQLQAALRAANLTLDRYLTDDRGWFSASPVPSHTEANTPA